MSGKILDLRPLVGEARNVAINEAVAVMEGWKVERAPGYSAAFFCFDPMRNPIGHALAAPHEARPYYPPYATSCDAVMPLLEKWRSALPEIRAIEASLANNCGTRWMVTLTGEGEETREAVYCVAENTFHLAACIALLRANGVEVLT